MQLPLQKGRTKSSRRLVEWGNEITKRIQNSVPYSFTSFCLAERSPFFLKLLEVLFLWICIPDLVNFCPTPSKNPTGTPGREEEAQEERQKEGQLELAQSCSDGEFPGANLSSGGMVHKI